MTTTLRTHQTNLHAGELDPLATSREDLTAYRNGAKLLRNFQRLNQGGATRRPGLRFHLQVLSSQPIETPLFGQAIPFIFSEDQAYIVVVLDGGAAKIYRLHDDGTVQPSQEISGGPWGSECLCKINYVHYADRLWMARRTWQVQEIQRVGLDAFELRDFLYEETSANSGITYEPFLKYARPEVTLNPSATTGDITLATSEDHWVAEHVGVKVRHEKKQMVISAVTDAKNANATVLETLSNTNDTTDWDEQAFSPVAGFPQAIALHEERTWLGGGSLLAGSKAGAPVNFDVGAGDAADSVQLEVNSERPPSIRHLLSGPHLQIFTDEGEHYMRTSTLNPTITPANKARLRSSTYGALITAKPVLYDEATLFVQRHGSTIREFRWREVQESYAADDMSILSAHLVAGTREMTVYFGNKVLPEPLIHMIHEDGTWATYTGIRKHNVSGLSRNDTPDGLVRSGCAIEERNFFLVDRIVGGRRELWLEEHDPNYLLDGARQRTESTPTSILTQLEHHNGSTVRVTDGRVDYGDYNVEGGQADISPWEVTAWEAGIPFVQQIQPLPPMAEINGQSVKGRSKRIVFADVDVLSSLGLVVTSRVEKDESTGKKMAVNVLASHQMTDDPDDPPKLVTGIQRFTLRGWYKDPTFTIENAYALPLTVRGIAYKWALASGD